MDDFDVDERFQAWLSQVRHDLERVANSDDPVFVLLTRIAELESERNILLKRLYLRSVEAAAEEAMGMEIHWKRFFE